MCCLEEQSLTSSLKRYHHRNDYRYHTERQNNYVPYVRFHQFACDNKKANNLCQPYVSR